MELKNNTNGGRINRWSPEDSLGPGNQSKIRLPSRLSSTWSRLKGRMLVRFIFYPYSTSLRIADSMGFVNTVWVEIPLRFGLCASSVVNSTSMKAELTAPKAKFIEACSWDQGKTSTLIVHRTLRNRSLAVFCNIVPCGGPEFRSKSKLHRKANEEQEKALHMDYIFV